MTVRTIAGGASCVPSLRPRRRGLVNTGRAHTHATAATLWAACTSARARCCSRVMMQPETRRPSRQHRFVRVLKEIVAGGGRRGQQMITRQRQAGRVVGRVVGHLRGMHTDTDRTPDVQPSAGCRRSMNVPPTLARFYAAVRRAWHRVERPRLVRMSTVHRAQGRSFDLTKQAALMMMRISGRLCTRRPRKVQVAAVLGRGRRARGYRRSCIPTGRRAAGAARRRWSLTDSGRCASSATPTPAPSSTAASSTAAAAAAASSRVLRRTAAALRTLLPRMETFADRRICQRWWTLAAQFVALSREHRQRRTTQTRMILQQRNGNRPVMIILRFLLFRTLWLYAQSSFTFFFLWSRGMTSYDVKISSHFYDILFHIARRRSQTYDSSFGGWVDPRTASHDFITAKRVAEQVLPRNCRSTLPIRLRKPIITRFRRGSRIRRPSSPRVSIPSSEIARPIETLSQGNAARNIDIIYPSGTLRRGP